MVMVIMQGTSGSGKSTLARSLALSLKAKIVSTDDFHFDEDGVYRFKFDEIGYFHNYNLFHAELCLKEGHNVIIDNTNIKQIFAQPYIDLAHRYGAEIIVRRCEGKYRNVHGVPLHTVERMELEMEKLDIDKRF